MAFEALGLSFVDDSNDEEYTQGLGQGSVELKPGGAGIDVTEETKAEYLQLGTALHRASRPYRWTRRRTSAAGCRQLCSTS